MRVERETEDWRFCKQTQMKQCCLALPSHEASAPLRNSLSAGGGGPDRSYSISSYSSPEESFVMELGFSSDRMYAAVKSRR